MSDPVMLLVCPTCPDAYAAPVDSSTGLPTVRPDLMTTVQTSLGPRWLAMCPECADAIVNGSAPPVSQV